MKIKTDEIKSTTIAGAIEEIEAILKNRGITGISGDTIEQIANHITLLDEDWNDGENDLVEAPKKYYVISREDISSNADPLNEVVIIQDHPGTTNQSGEEKLSGWLGTTNDNAEYAHGEFDSLEDAQDYIAENMQFEHFTLLDDYDLESGEIEAYQDTREVWKVDDYLFNFAKDQVSETITDAEIKNLVIEIEAEIERENIYVDGDIEDYFLRFCHEIMEQNS